MFGISTLKFPCASVSTSTFTSPGKVTVTVEFASALPVTCVSSLDISFNTGASGAVASTTVVETSGEILPLESDAVTFNNSLPVKSISSGILIV